MSRKIHGHTIFWGGDINPYLLSVFLIFILFQADHSALCNFFAPGIFFFQAESQSSLKPKALSVFYKNLNPFHETLIPKAEWEGERAIP